jgi:hypothetical protein
MMAGASVHDQVFPLLMNSSQSFDMRIGARLLGCHESGTTSILMFTLSIPLRLSISFYHVFSVPPTNLVHNLCASGLRLSETLHGLHTSCPVGRSHCTALYLLGRKRKLRMTVASTAPGERLVSVPTISFSLYQHRLLQFVPLHHSFKNYFTIMPTFNAN